MAAHDELSRRPVEEWPAYLTAHSGLPGPRANLELADDFARVADRATILAFGESSDEYLRFCGTQALGRLVAEDPADASLDALLRVRAGDASWRVREAAARALQLVGDRDPDLMIEIVERWAAAEEPYLRRAAVAGVCEPRLLTSPRIRDAAIRACRVATDSIVATPPAARSSAAVRTLRQALGYCWSVVVAADPARGLPAFRALTGIDDDDVRWIVTSNRTKRRLQKVEAAQR